MTGLSKARILVTNDDGIHAPGLKACVHIAKALSDDVWVVAPESEQSAASHSLTLRRPLRLRKIGPRRFTVDGTPTDCVVMAVREVLADGPPDLILSGVNHGANLGEDVHYSGTVAAAMEGTLLGIRSIAFSQVRSSTRAISWKAAEELGPDIVSRLMSADWPREVLMNVNFPALPLQSVKGAQVCRQGRRDTQIQVAKGKDPGGRDYYWIGDFLSDATSQKNTDLAVIESGAVSVTPLHLDLTHSAAMKRLNSQFG